MDSHIPDANDLQLKVVGEVTPKERDDLHRLFERKNGLEELIKTFSDLDKNEKKKFYDKVVDDTAKVTASLNNWWNEKSAQYRWKSAQGYRWQIDFNTCKIFFVRSDCASCQESNAPEQKTIPGSQ